MKRAVGVALAALFALGLAQPIREFTDWSPAVNLGLVVNSESVDSCVTVSKDRLTLIFSSNRPGGMGGRDLYVTTRETVDSDWIDPQALTMLNSPVWDSCPALSVDERRLYFTSAREPSCGWEDIWVASRPDRKDPLGWEAPVSLGCADDGYLNTKGSDLTPTFFEDDAGNEVIYFASTHQGLGQFDFYQSVMRPDGTFGPPTEVEELSSNAVDIGITVRRDGLEVIFLSQRKGASGNQWSFDFWTATRASTEDPWSAPVFVPSLGSPSWASGRIALTFDARELYFTRRGDLWVARRERLH